MSEPTPFDRDSPDRDHLTEPPPDPLPTGPRVLDLAAGSEFLRIYDPVPRGDTELTFRHWGPALRFDHHRAPFAAPDHDGERGVWYGAPLEQEGAARALELCLWECFAGERRVDLRFALGRVQVSSGETLHLLSLVDDAAADAGTIAQIASTPDVRMSQARSRYFWEHPDLYGPVDGLLYRSAWIGAINVVLYERAAPKLERVGLGSMLVSYPLLAAEVAAIASARGWTLAVAV